jgi:hypothetical protein
MDLDPITGAERSYFLSGNICRQNSHQRTADDPKQPDTSHRNWMVSGHVRFPPLHFPGLGWRLAVISVAAPTSGHNYFGLAEQFG